MIYNIYSCGIKGVQPVLQIVPIPASVQNIPGRNSKAINEIVFRTSNIPPLGIQAYVVTKKTMEEDEDVDVDEQSRSTKFISNEVNRFVPIYNINY